MSEPILRGRRAIPGPNGDDPTVWGTDPELVVRKASPTQTGRRFDVLEGVNCPPRSGLVGSGPSTTT